MLLPITLAPGQPIHEGERGHMVQGNIIANILRKTRCGALQHRIIRQAPSHSVQHPLRFPADIEREQTNSTTLRVQQGDFLFIIRPERQPHNQISKFVTLFEERINVGRREIAIVLIGPFSNTKSMITV